MLKKINFLVILCTISILLISCSSKSSTFVFSDADWSSTPDDLATIHGTCDDIYDSSYGGSCYVYEDISFGASKGAIKYYYDNNDTLRVCEFVVIPTSSFNTESIYTEYHNILKDTYGEVYYTYDAYKNVEYGGLVGDYWYGENHFIILTSLNLDAGFIKNFNVLIKYENPQYIDKTYVSNLASELDKGTKEINALIDNIF